MLKKEYKDKEITDNPVLQKKFKDLLFLASPDFPQIVKQYNLDFYHHNYLMGAHILTMGLFSTAIKDGDIHITYPQEIVADGDNIPMSKVEFGFVTRTNAVIYNGQCHNNSIAISNPLFGLSCRGTRDFRDFIIEYGEKILKIPTLDEIAALNDSMPKIYFKRWSNPSTQINHAYERIISNHKIVHDLLLFHQIEQKFIANDTVEVQHDSPNMKL